MRELKFRAILEVDTDKETGVIEMVYFKPAECDNGMWFDPPKHIHHINEYLTPFMQYTGLKDKNGKEIYEGDVLVHLSKSNIKGVASFFEGSFIIGKALTSNSLINFNAPKNLQIIGNIHENPELL